MKWLCRKLSITARKLFVNLTFLSFLNGFLIASLCYFHMEDNYEKQLFSALAMDVRQRVGQENMQNEDSIVVASLHLTHMLGEGRAQVFGERNIHSLKSKVLHPVSFDLMTLNGACGSYAYILGRLLKEFDIPVRFAQMRVNGLYGGHNVIEAKTQGRWAVLDATYDLHFINANGKLASFSDVSNDWNGYSRQLPQGYDMNYSYADVRYTNWNKIPVIMPLAKKIMSFTRGKKAAEEFSLRNLFLEKYQMLFRITAIVYMLATLLLLAQVAKRYPLSKHLPFKKPNFGFILRNAGRA